MSKSRITFMLLAYASCLPRQAFSQANVADQTHSHIVVGPNVQVSRGHSGDTHYEVLVSADREDPNRLIACSILFPDGRQTISNIVYATIDGGETWQTVLEPVLPSDAVAGDPACIHGPDRSAYYTVSVLPPGPRSNRSLLFYRSADGGLTWDAPTRLTYSDRQYITVDASDGPYHGRVYVNGNNRIPEDVSDLVVFHSSDGGTSFVGPTRREGFGSFVVPTMGNAVVLSDGTLVALFVENVEGTNSLPTQPASQQLKVALSNDGGATLKPARPVTDVVMGAGRKGSHNNVNSLPFIAADESSGPYRDRLYVVWPDRRSGRSEIYFISSPDRGRTWSRARVINDDTPNTPDASDHFMPNVAVNRDGVVGVIWYDRRNHPDNMGWDVRFAASLDGGATFLPSAQISESGTRFGADDRWPVRATVTSQPDSGRPDAGVTVDLNLNNFMFLGGDTAGIAADATGVFHPVWVDNRTGTPQLWTTRVMIRHENLTSTPADAPTLDDVSNLVTLEVLDVRSDRESNTVTVRVRLANTSSRRVLGPIVVRVVSLDSELGEITIGRDGYEGLGVPAWSFANELDDNELVGGAVSKAKSLSFTITDLQPFREGDRYRLGLVRFRAVILGTLSNQN